MFSQLLSPTPNIWVATVFNWLQPEYIQANTILLDDYFNEA